MTTTAIHVHVFAAVAAFWVAAASGGIPVGYTQGEYVQGDGTTGDVAAGLTIPPKSGFMLLVK